MLSSLWFLFVCLFVFCHDGACRFFFPVTNTSKINYFFLSFTVLIFFLMALQCLEGKQMFLGLLC